MNENEVNNHTPFNGAAHREWPSTATIETNPYRNGSTGVKEAPTKPALDVSPPETAPEKEFLDSESGPRVGRRRLIFSAALVAFAICVGLGLWLRFGGSTRVDYLVKDQRRGQAAGRAAAGATGVEQSGGSSDHQATEQAIAEVKQAINGADPTPGAPQEQRASDTPNATNAPIAPLILPQEVIANRSMRENGAVESTKGDNAAGPRGDRTAVAGGSRSGYAGGDRGAPQYKTASMYASDAEDSRPASPGLSRAAAPIRPERNATKIEPAPPVLPSFGSLLPVRTLGAIYTLRPSLARLELTRDVSGEGWSLKRGTVLIGQQRGSELDRAYVSLLGFIDPASGKFVKVSGDLLGSDGAPGVRGKRRQISSRWTRVLSRAATGAVALGQAALSRGGGATVVLPGAVAPEVTPNFNTISRREFVEVDASATGYVLITDLPNEARGVDAEPNTEAKGDALTDEELADVLSSGAPEKIRAAMPRMSPEMKRLAQEVLKEK